MKYTFFYYLGDKLIYAGNCLNIEKLIERHKHEYNNKIYLNGYDAYFYKYLLDRNLRLNDLVFKYKDAEFKNSIEVMQHYKPRCNISLETVIEEYHDNYYLFYYYLNDKLLYIGMYIGSHNDIQNYKIINNDIYKTENECFLEYIKMKKIKLRDLKYVYKQIKVSEVSDLRKIRDYNIRQKLPLCNIADKGLKVYYDDFVNFIKNDIKDSEKYKYHMIMLYMNEYNKMK